MNTKTHTHTLTCLNGKIRVKTLVVHKPSQGGFWYSIAGSHMVSFVQGKPFRSGKQLGNVSEKYTFTYYGNGTDQRPDCVTNMETLLWLLRKNEKIKEN